MVTIKEFASLCGCNAQTLRYYDKIDLLKPIHVDPWSGYRYYTKVQAIDFVKIKNFQAAGFSIEEIKSLLTMSDQQISQAFAQKINEHLQMVEQIKIIQKSYLTEKKNMENLVQNVSDYLLHAVTDYSVLREFGMSPEEGPAVVSRLKAYIEKITLRNLPSESDICMRLNDQVITGADKAADAFATLKGKGYEDTVLLGDESIHEEVGFTSENSEQVWECHGWIHPYEFLDSLPCLDAEYDYCFMVQLAEEKYLKGLEFSLFLIASVLEKIGAEELAIGCSMERSEDHKNHAALLRKKIRT